MIYFTSDTHFGHKRILEYERGADFTTVEEHDEHIINQWQKQVKKGDVVYHLGDFALCSKTRLREILPRLPGQINLVRGNHDQIMRGDFKRFFGFIRPYYETNIEGTRICMMHFPIEIWNNRHKGAIHLHGHCHGNMKQDPAQPRMDVGVDNHPEYGLFSLEEVISHTSQFKPDTRDHHENR